MAGYTAHSTMPDGNTKAFQVIVDDVRSTECPKSIMIRDPKLRDLIHSFNQARKIKGAMGSPVRWPGAYFDAVSLLHEQEAIDKNAFLNAR